MLTLEISFGILPVAGLIIVSFLVGFILRSGQISSHRRKVIELEKEMLRNHAEILNLQKERAALHKHMNESSIPVIPMNSAKENKSKVSDKS